MKKSKWLLGVVLVGVLAGCASVNSMWSQRYLFGSTSSTSIQQMDAKQLYAVESNDLCAAYNGTMSPIIQTEIQRRGFIVNPKIWTDVNNNKIWMGMTLCELLASQGKPDLVVKAKNSIELDYETQAYTVKDGMITDISHISPKKTS